MTQVSKKEQEAFLKDLKKFHRNMGWANLPRKTKCYYCKEYHHECKGNWEGLGLQACHSCANVEERKRFKQTVKELENKSKTEPLAKYEIDYKKSLEKHLTSWDR